MAQVARVTLIDDTDSTEIPTGGERVQFALDGVGYEIDLSDKNAATMREAIGFYIGHARRLGGRRQTTRHRHG